MSLPSVMKLLVEELNGTYERFVQGTGPAKLPPDLTGGYCQGACIAWLVMVRTGASLRSELKREPEGYQHYMASIQRDAMQVGYAKMSPTQPTIALHLEKTLADKGFSKAGTRLPGFPFDTIASYIWNNGNGGYYFVLVPAHAMAAHAVKDTLRLFDPNAGEARFATYDAFELFVCRYFCHKEVVEAYNYPLLNVNLREDDNLIKEANKKIAVYRLNS